MTPSAQGRRYRAAAGRRPCSDDDDRPRRRGAAEQPSGGSSLESDETRPRSAVRAPFEDIGSTVELVGSAVVLVLLSPGREPCHRVRTGCGHPTLGRSERAAARRDRRRACTGLLPDTGQGLRQRLSDLTAMRGTDSGVRMRGAHRGRHRTSHLRQKKLWSDRAALACPWQDRLSEMGCQVQCHREKPDGILSTGLNEACAFVRP